MKFSMNSSFLHICRGLQIMFLLIVSLSTCENCRTEYQNQLFDFSGLALKPWNVSDISENSAGLVHASLSLCNHLHESPCGNVSFCVVGKDHSKWFNFNSTPIVQEGDNFKISFFLKEMQFDSTMKAEISLKCSQEIGKPKFQEFKENNLFILWETIAACKIKYPDPYRKCIIKDKDNNEINIQSLRHLQYYTTVDSKKKRYYVNVCGGTVSDSICPSADSNVAACEIDSSNNSVILGVASRQNIVEKDLSLQFRNKTRKFTVKIELICNTRVNTGELKFKSLEGDTRIFELETSLVCLTKLPHCIFSDDDHLKYDLSSLRDKDYEVYDSQSNKYILSVCKTVNSSLCPGGASVCLKNGSFSLNLGTLRTGPEINEEEKGQLHITTSGGSYCNGMMRYKSVIVFKCSKKNSHPILRGITSECVYSFDWYTKAACPFMAEIGENCQVSDPAYGYNFNFNSLRKYDADYILNGNDGQKFHLNLCGDLLEPCNGSKNVSVCLSDVNRAQHKIGEIADSPLYKDGRLSFELSGEACKSSEATSKVMIIFTCNCTAKENESYPSLYEKFENCTYIFLWPTIVACPECTVHNCQVSDENGETYDLSSLSLYDKDYIIWDNKTNVQRKFILNICQPIIFVSGSRCNSQTGVCVQNMTEPNFYQSFTNLGVSSGLQYDKERKTLKVEYVNGGFCKDGDRSEKRSVINFICDREATKPSHPQLIKESDCDYEFAMKTKHACSKSSGPKKTIIKEKKCEVYNAFTAMRVDLSEFAGHEYSINDTVGGSYRLTICGSLNNASLHGIGMCRKTATDCENLGMGNSDLRYEAGRLFLNYTDGVNCSPNAKSYTEIDFVCSRGNNWVHPITSTNPCAYSVVWYTSIACMVPCKTNGATEVDISFLSNYDRNYKTSVNGVDYFINICKPLVTKEGLNCFPGSAVCRAVPGKRNEWTNEVSLGMVYHRPVLLDNKIVLNYSSNFLCPNNALHNLTSSILFVCDLMVGIGSPVLNQLMNECHYEFLWKTSVVCPNYTIQVGALSTGFIINNQSSTVLNLQPLRRIETYNVENYVISVCDSLFEVKKIDRERKITYGRADSILFNYSENLTQLFISHGDECKTNSSDRYHAVINLLCSSKADEYPHILKETDCSVEFEWESSAACAQRISVDTTDATSNATDATTVQSLPQPQNKSSIGTLGVIFSTLLTVAASLCLLCFLKYSGKNYFRRYYNRFLRRRHEGEYHYDMGSPDLYESEELL